MKILVSAESRHGSTTEVAATIGEVLRAAGHEVWVLAPEEVASVAGFDAAVIGSAIYVGHWLEPARDLVERHHAALSRIPTWLFSSGPVGDPPKPAELPVDVPGLVRLIGPRDHRVFSGLVDKRRLGFGERALMAAVRAPEGDFRHWDEIQGWAREIAASLVRVPA